LKKKLSHIWNFSSKINNFVNDDGQGNRCNDEGMTVTIAEMDLEEEIYLIKTLANFGRYFDFKPPEKPEKKAYTAIRKYKSQDGTKHQSS
jgi:hypothetical protein